MGARRIATAAARGGSGLLGRAVESDFGTLRPRKIGDDGGP